MADIAQRMLTRCGEAGISITREQAASFHRFHTLLTGANARFNLTRVPPDPEEACDRNYFDSIAPLAAFRGASSIADVGSGAGFPGIPLAILLPDARITLIESLQKRADFLRDAARELHLANVRILALRAEDAGRGVAREEFDIACARAVAPLAVLAELLLPLVRVGGRMLAYKGPAAAEELSAAETAIGLLGGESAGVLPCPIPGRDWEHKLVQIAKIAPTPAQYPRRAGVPEKKPL